jgi:hypothetical protein
MNGGVELDHVAMGPGYLPLVRPVFALRTDRQVLGTHRLVFIVRVPTGPADVLVNRNGTPPLFWKRPA